ncbi:MAG TPA: RidA family protein [Candidatus Latescibacteria bacterium]|nr:RidA family protein [Candidatus Latescibacterota bacterium]
MSDTTKRDGEQPTVNRRPVSATSALNEAYHYQLPSSFSRGMRIDLPCVSMIYISGTASVDENGATAHVGDFEGQVRRTFRNITELLKAEGLTWKHVVRTTCYLKDIQRHYDEFNRLRTEFYKQQGLDPLPASTGIEARLCRDDLLVEIEAIAMVPGPNHQGCSECVDKK